MLYFLTGNVQTGKTRWLMRHIEKLEAEIAERQTELSKPEVFTNAARIVELQKEIADREAELEKAYERYEELDALG